MSGWQHQTVGRNYNAGKIAHVVCVPNDKLGDTIIQNDCFLLLIITEGSASFRVGIDHVTAQAPCFVCFDETENPILISKKKLRCRAIYFHPQFLNINMSFEVIRTGFYGDIAREQTGQTPAAFRHNAIAARKEQLQSGLNGEHFGEINNGWSRCFQQVICYNKTYFRLEG